MAPTTLAEAKRMILVASAKVVGAIVKNCECQTCEAEKKGAFRKLKQGERKDLDYYTPEEEKKIVQVNSMFYRVHQNIKKLSEFQSNLM